MRSTSPNSSPAEEKTLHPVKDTAPWNAGGAKGTRTPDPLLAKQMLSQLSYRPRVKVKSKRQKVKVEGGATFFYLYLLPFSTLR